MEAKVKIQKWGNDLGISFPMVIVNELSLREGLYVNVQNNGNEAIIKPIKPNSYNLTDMLNEITENNVHHSIEWEQSLYDKTEEEKERFRKLLLSGPVMEDEQYQEYTERRYRYKTWNKK